MSYNIMKKRAGFAGSTEGTIENIVDTHTDQTINGSKSFSNTVTSSADVMLSGSGKISASFFYGDGSGLSGVSSGGAAAQGPVESIQFHTGSGGLSGSANLTFLTSSNTLEVTGDISASVNISASSFYGDGSNLTDIAAANISGQLSPTQIAHSSPLTNSGGTLDVKIVSNSGIIDSSGLKLGIDSMNVAPYNDTYFVAVSDGLDNPYKIQFSTIESSINIDGNNITGSNSINNAVLPSIINQSVISASTGISGAFFEGDGSGLTNVSAGPGGADTEIQFNNAGTIDGSPDLTFENNSLISTTASFSKISSSLVPDANNTFYLGAQDLSSRWASVNSVAADFSGLAVIATGAVSHRFGIGTLNPTNELEVTGNTVVVGNISASAGITGSAFYGDGTTLTGVPFASAPGTSNIVYVADGGAQTLDSNGNLQWTGTKLATTNITASSNLEVGGHISGSGDLRLLNDGSIRLGGSSTISFDDGAGQLSSISQGGTNQLTIEAHNRLTIKADEYVIFHDSANNERLVVDYRTTDPTPIQIIRTDLPISSSSFVSASSFANGGGTLITEDGDFQGNNASFNEITASSVISSSAEISASSFHGDGSALTGIGGSTTFEDHIKTSSYFVFNAGTYWIPLAGNNPAARNQLDNVTFLRWGGIHYVAPASGSLKRFKMIAFNNSQTIYSATPSKIDIILTLSKNDTTVSAASATGAPHGHITASANTYVVASGSYGLVWDIPIEGNSEFSGSNTFDPGDVLKMTNRFASVQAAGNNYDTQMTITFELSGSDD